MLYSFVITNSVPKNETGI